MLRLLTVLAIVLFTPLVGSAADRNILQTIVEGCLDTSAANYCGRCRAPQWGQCPTGQGCRDTTEVWALTPDYVAIRDIKMCENCPTEFVHGLAMPRARVTGVEDPRRPEGIWRFAWDVAVTRIEKMKIALVVNPPGVQRSQDQLHVHLVRLKDDMRPRLAQREPVTVERLEEVWTTAARRAAAKRLPSYGVVVVRSEGAGFLVLVEGASVEYEWTEARCGSK